MKRRRAKIGLSQSSRSGLSLVETVVSTLLVGLLLVAATKTVGSSVLAQQKTATFVNASALADSLMSEILTLPYMEPGATTSVIGRESGESSSSKVNYDDVDDFEGWQEQPPQYRDGTNMQNVSGWKRSVFVQFITIAGNGSVSTSNSESNIKRIQVQVTWNSSVIVERQALVTNL